MTVMIILTITNVSEAKVKFTEKAGGTMGTSFMLPSERVDILNTEFITRISIQHGRRIEQIEIEYSCGKRYSQVESVGNDSGKWSYIDLEEGEYIIYVKGRAGTLIDQLTFYTNMRRKFGPYGGSGGQAFNISVPNNAKVIGFTGKVGPSINQIGLIYRTADKGFDISKYQHKGTYFDPTIEEETEKPSKRIVRDQSTKNTNNESPKKTVIDHRTKVKSPATPPGVPIPYPNISIVKDNKYVKKIRVKK